GPLMKQERSGRQVGEIERGPVRLFFDVVPNDGQCFISEVRINKNIEIIRDSATHQSQYSFGSVLINQQRNNTYELIAPADLDQQWLCGLETSHPGEQPFRTLKCCGMLTSGAEIAPFWPKALC